MAFLQPGIEFINDTLMLGKEGKSIDWTHCEPIFAC